MPTDTTDDERVVCHLVERLSFGGAQSVVEKLATRLLTSRYRPLVCCMQSGPLGPVLQSEGVEVVSFDFARRSVLTGPIYIVQLVRLLRSLVAMVRRHRVDVIHAHLPDAILVAAVVGYLTKTPVVATYHGLRIVPPERSRLDPRNPARRALYRLAGRIVDKTIAVSPQVLTMLRDELGFRSRDTVLIVNGIETDELDQAPVPDALRTELELSPKHRVVTCVGRFVEHKRQCVLIEAMVHVVARFPDAVLVLVGEGRSRAELEQCTQRHDMKDHVRFVGARSDVPAILALTEVFALTSSYEGTPVSVLEAMAAGRPVVASRVPGNEDVIVDGRSGLLVPPESPIATAEAISRLFADTSFASDLAGRGRQRARDSFDIQGSVDLTISLYDDVLSTRRAQALSRGG